MGKIVFSIDPPPVKNSSMPGVSKRGEAPLFNIIPPLHDRNIMIGISSLL